MAWLDIHEGQPLPSIRTRRQRSVHKIRKDHGGPKGPPSAPPTIPPIIITPYTYEMPQPAIDPRKTPARPPPTPQRHPAMVW